MKKTILGLSALILASCAMSSPVVGIVGVEAEKFTGTASRTYPASSGVLTVKSDKGTTCTGKFRYFKGGNSGSGRFTCTDGRAGKYDFTVNGLEGYGVGKTFDGENVAFYFSRPKQ